MSRVSHAKYLMSLLQVLKQFDKIFELNVARSLHLHDVDQNVAESNVVLLEFEVAVVELFKFLLVHVAHIGFGLRWTYLNINILLSYLKHCSICAVEESCSTSGATPSSKKRLSAFWMFHLLRER